MICEPWMVTKDQAKQKVNTIITIIGIFCGKSGKALINFKYTTDYW